MRRFTTIMLLLGATAFTASAQVVPAFGFGLKGGVNFAQLKTSSDLTNSSNRTGYQVGIWSRVGAAGFHLQPELYLTGKGNKFESITVNGTQQNQEGTVNFTALDLPVLVGTRIGLGPLGARLQAGPVVSFIVNEDTNFSSAYNNVTNFGNYKDQAWGFILGGGVDVGKISVDLRYEFGLTNLSESETYKQKANLASLSLGIKLF